ncbi:MAG: tRNA1(Val) (adenine(37)-N6)-methyltransferase [Mycoplasmatota bacterium]
MEVKNYLLGYKNLYIMQNTEMFNFSIDSVLLPNFATITKKTKKILDIGTGNAPIPIILSTKTKAKITAIEIQRDVYKLAKKSLELNKLEEKIELLNEDIIDYAKECPTDTFDLITCNPPFFKLNSASKLNDNDYKTIARHEIKLNIFQVCEIAKKLLKNNGYLAIVHRSDRMMDIVTAMRSNNIEPKTIQFVYPKNTENSNAILIEGIKNAKPGLKIKPPLVVHNDNGKYTKEIESYFK